MKKGNKKSYSINLWALILIIAIIVSIIAVTGKLITKTKKTNSIGAKMLSAVNAESATLCLDVAGGPVTNPIKGDVNKDGFLTYSDARIIYNNPIYIIR